MRIRLVGLPDELGPGTFACDAKSPAEGLRAYVVNYPLAFAWIVRQNFAVYDERHNLSENEVFGPCPHDSALVYVPAIGGGGPLVLIAAGAAMMGGSLLIPVGMTVFGMGVAGMVASVGLSLILSGVASLLTPKPKAPGSGSLEKPEDMPSAYFNGAVNTVEPGHPVPVGYGTMMVGSQVISAGLSAENF
ncbi:tail assembly protein [Cupriavidus taiwanensis]|uniref:tail assembly protein n=1 Tax=Cupriavidus taiwanensis TaxID=164546 RepID=UPI000E19D6EE|nr:tail assembly protein [Cupriavidus taiwanensis]SPA17263.1 putative Lambda tail assembly I [Cupriavidus taiwanensis]